MLAKGDSLCVYCPRFTSPKFATLPGANYLPIIIKGDHRMKNRKALLLLGGIVLLMLVASVIIRSNASIRYIKKPVTAQAQDPKAEIKHQRREARYSAEKYSQSRVTVV